MKLKLHFILPVFLLISGSVFSVPLSGVYTIGGSSPSYATFTAAVNDLNTFGVNGPVIFNVRPGTYTEQIYLDTIRGASPTNRITFQSESGRVCDVTLIDSSTSTTNNYIVYLNGASYLTFNNLSITNTGADYATVFVIAKSTSDSILNNILTVPVYYYYYNVIQNSTYFLINAAPATANSDSIVVIGNQMNNGSYGFEAFGSNIANGVVIENNNFSNQTGFGITMASCPNAIIQGNTVSTNVVPLADRVGDYGIYVGDGCENVSVLNNTLYGSLAYGLYIPNTGSAGNEGLIANNFISAQYCIVGISTAYQLFYYNSLNAGEYAFDMESCSNNVLEDNIISGNSGSTPLMYLDNSSSPAFSASDYNDFYTTGMFAEIITGGNTMTYFPDLGSWQDSTGFDAHSRFILPPFTSSSNLHLTDYTSMRFGKPISAVTIDIDSSQRGPNPTVGADDTGAVVFSLPAFVCCACAEAAFIADYTTICEGNTIHFTGQTGNNPGKWQWTFAGGTPDTSTAQNPTVIYNNPGTYSVTLIVSNSNGMDSLTKTGYITVNPPPVPGAITGPNVICAEESTQLSDTGSTGAIQWQSSAGGASFTGMAGDTSSPITLTGVSQTNYYRVVVSNTCGTDSSASFKLTVNLAPVPSISTTDSMICSNDSTNVCTADTFVSYLWNTGNTSFCITVEAAGGYWVTVTDANHCSAVSGHQDISVYPVPSVSITVQGDTLSSFGAVSYRWYFNNNLIPNATGQVYIAGETGNYSVEVTDTNGCKALSNNTYVSITGVSQPGESSLLTIYPDPFTNTIFIKEDETRAVIQSIKIYDVLGRVVINSACNNNSTVLLTLDVSVLTHGAYFIQITTNEAEYTRCLVKQ